jgi:hypothetical protein
MRERLTMVGRGFIGLAVFPFSIVPIAVLGHRYDFFVFIQILVGSLIAVLGLVLLILSRLFDNIDENPKLRSAILFSDVVLLFGKSQL